MSVIDRRRTSIGNLKIEFQRTLRIPDDGKIYPLPAGFGRFPLRHVDDHKETVPESWIERWCVNADVPKRGALDQVPNRLSLRS